MINNERGKRQLEAILKMLAEHNNDTSELGKNPDNSPGSVRSAPILVDNFVAMQIYALPSNGVESASTPAHPQSWSFCGCACAAQSCQSPKACSLVSKGLLL